MRQRLRSHLTYANVMVTILAFIVLGGGTALGAFIVSSNSQIGPGTVSGHQPPSGKHSNIIAGSVTGQDVRNNSLTWPKLAPSALPRGRAQSSTYGCDPTDENDFIDCGHVTIHLARASRVLVVTTAQWFGNNVGGVVHGTCRIGVDAVPFGADASPGDETNSADLAHQSSLALTNVTNPLPPGNHTLGLACDEVSGDIEFAPTYISAVVLSPG
jgi:hypothetical protein